MSFISELREKAKKNPKRIVLPEGNDKRILEAAEIIKEEKIASEVVVIGELENITTICDDNSICLDHIELVQPDKSNKLNEYAAKYYEKKKAKGISEEDARNTVLDPLYYGAMMVNTGDADGMVAGAAHSTADTVRSALRCIGTAPNIRVVSSCFIMIVPDCEYGENGILLFADSGVIPNPTVSQLSDIAYATANSYKQLIGGEPRIAMLSFSTKGSAKHKMANKIIEATNEAKSKYPELKIDGELQADAALVPSIAKKKAPNSNIAGNANVLIFPDLNSGNIGYKLVQRLAKAEAFGPLLQGLVKPVNDLSRGCSIEDIVNVVAITELQSN